MSEGRSRSLAYAAVAFQTAISAGTYLAAKHALSHMGWAAVVMLRNLGGSALLVALLAATPGPFWPPRSVLPRVLLLAALVVPLNQALFIGGLASTTPAHAALMYTLTPLFVLLLSVYSGVESLAAGKVIGVLLALAGATLVVLERSGGVSGAGPMHGDLLVLCAVVAWAFYTVVGRKVVQDYGAMKATGWSLVGGTILYAPYGLPKMAEVDVAALPWTVWAALGFLVVLTSVVSYLCWSYALKHLEPSRVAVFSNLQPVATAALSWLMFGERITGRLALGGAFVIAGVVAATARVARRRVPG